jgi:hypothetical protein
MQRYLWAKAPELASLDELRLPNLLKLPGLGIDWHPHNNPYRVGKLLFLHGHIVRRHAGASAQAHVQRYGESVIHGHAHRLGHYSVRQGTVTHGGWENPCLCGLNPEFDPSPNWQQGFSVVHHEEDGWFSVEQVHYLNGRYGWRGVTYGEERDAVFSDSIRA